MPIDELLIVGAILVATVVSSIVFRFFYFRFLKRNALIQLNDPTRYKFLGYLIIALIYVVGFSWAIYRIEELRTIAQSLLAGAGILAVAVGFASQHALSNIISGLFIVIFKPFKIGERIILSDDQMGMVEDITLRHTVIRDYDNRRIVIPNSIISDQTLVNVDMIDPRISRKIIIGISYDADIDRAKEIIMEEVVNHRFFVDVRKPEDIAEGKPLLQVRVVALGDFAVELRAWPMVTNLEDALALHFEVLESVKKRFDQEGIEIPFPYRTLVFKNDITNHGDKEIS